MVGTALETPECARDRNHGVGPVVGAVTTPVVESNCENGERTQPRIYGNRFVRASADNMPSVAGVTRRANGEFCGNKTVILC